MQLGLPALELLASAGAGQRLRTLDTTVVRALVRSLFAGLRVSSREAAPELDEAAQQALALRVRCALSALRHCIVALDVAAGEGGGAKKRPKAADALGM